MLQLLELQKEPMELTKGMVDEHNKDPELKKMLESVTNGELPVYFCKEGKAWKTDIKSGKKVLGKGFYIPQQKFRVVTDGDRDMLFPIFGSGSYGLMCNNIRQTLEGLTVTTTNINLDQFFLEEDQLLIVSTLVISKPELLKIESNPACQLPFYGLDDGGQLDFVLYSGQIIEADHPDWPKHFEGFDNTKKSPIDREIMGLIA